MVLKFCYKTYMVDNFNLFKEQLKKIEMRHTEQRESDDENLGIRKITPKINIKIFWNDKNV